ncbi:MAG: nucleotidyltransferase family protein [Boseongicola sp.]|nr:nucleotidyltransferase family protein [Boseongicola sp.]
MDGETLKSLTIGPEVAVRDAIAAIDRSRRQIALVVDPEFNLVATVTDGDVRRGILNGVDLDGPVSLIMHTNPTTVLDSEPADAVRRIMREKKLQHVPVLDESGRLVDLATLDKLFGLITQDTRVVLMAGGLGKRLRPLTETMPKPMLPVGGKPLLEQIIGVFADQGFSNISISVNYRREMVMDHFKDGAQFGVDIDYIEENEPLGTAGALSLMTSRPDSPFIVMNGDLLVSMEFSKLLKFHEEQGAAGTMVVREYTHQVPYGVVRSDGSIMTGIEEKPVERYFVNGGIYVLSPDAFDYIEADEPLDMPTLLMRMREAGKTVAVYPMSEYWRDIGRIDDLEAARSEFDSIFGG